MSVVPPPPPPAVKLLPEAGIRGPSKTQTGEVFVWARGSEIDPSCGPAVRGTKPVDIAAGPSAILVLTDQGQVIAVDAESEQQELIAEGKVPGAVLAEEKGRSTESGDGAGGEKKQDPSSSPQGLSWMCPKALQSLRVACVACGDGHNVVGTTDGRVYAWGRGDEGQLGLGMGLNSPVPQLVTQLQNRSITQVACGKAHTAALTDSGALYCWGRNFEGQCGTGSHTKGTDEPRASARVQLAPKFVGAFLGVFVSRVACGHLFTSCITGQGEVWCWGEGGVGQLGVGRVTKKDFPQLSAAADITHDRVGFRDVSCGWGHCVAVSRAGELFVWGFNQYGTSWCDRAARFACLLVPVPVWLFGFLAGFVARHSSRFF